MSRRSVSVLLAGQALLFVSTLPAAGIEAEGVAGAIGAALTKGSHAQAAYGSATLEGDDVVIVGLTFTGTTSGESVRFEKAVVESPTEDGTGLFHSPRVTLSGGSAIGEPNGSVESVTANDVTVLDPAAMTGEGFAEAILYRSAEVRGVRVTRESEPSEISVERIAMEFGDASDGGPRDVAGTVEGLSVSPDIFEHRRLAILSRAKAGLEKLGFDTLVFDADWEGSWDEASGTMTVRDSTFTFRDNATVSVSGTVGSLPDPRVLNDPDVIAQAAKLQFYDLVARYEDKSLIGRVFDLMADEQEVSRAEYVEQLSQALPFLLAGMTDAEFRQALIAALREFFQDPRSLTVKIEPEAPISGSEIISIARSALGTLPGRLGASVSANAHE